MGTPRGVTISTLGGSVKHVNVSIRAMSMDDYAQVVELWRTTEGIGLSDADSESGVDSFLLRNPGMSAVCHAPSGELVGAVLCGHDGRRGCTTWPRERRRRFHFGATTTGWRGTISACFKK